MHIFKTRMPALSKMHAKPRKHPLNHPPTPSTFPASCKCQRPRRRQAGAQTHFIVNLLLYGWFITKGFQLSCPPLMRRARRHLLFHTPGGATFAHITDIAKVSEGSAPAYCQLISSSVNNAEYETSNFKMG